MDISHKDQCQFELFPASHGQAHAWGKFPNVYKNLTLPLENIIFLSIVLIMLIVLSFSFGVERGKNLVKNTVPVKTVVQPAQAVQRTPAPNTVNGVRPINSGVNSGNLPMKTNLIPNQKPVQPTPVRAVIQQPVIEQKIIVSPYTIQVASFAQEKYAKEEAKKLQIHGLETFVLNKGKYSIVCIGKFGAKEETKGILRRLKGTYKDLIVRRL